MQVTIVALFGVVALLLAFIGVYGVVNFNATQRVREIGIRTALGATRAGVLYLMVRRSLAPIVVGFAVGGVLTVAIIGLLRGVVFGLNGPSVANLFQVGLTFLAVSIGASVLPAWKATCVDPVDVLRG